MARLRRFDCTKIYNESWDGPTRDIFFYLCGVAADNYGLLKEAPELIAAALHLSPAKVRDRLGILMGQEVVIRYSDGQQPFLAFRKWQDYQSVKYPGYPACPIPPLDILGKLSPKTQELFQRFVGSLPRNSSSLVAVAVALPTYVGPKSPVQAAVNHYLERLRRKTRMESPEFPYGQANAFFARRIRQGDTYEDLQATIDYFFDHWITDASAASYTHYQSKYNALAAGAITKKGKEKTRADHPGRANTR